MNATPDRFAPAARALHWLMAVLIVAMLFIGVGMVATVSARHEWLLAIHKPLGIAILLLAVVRLAVRLRHPPPPLPADLPGWQALAAKASHVLLYALMLFLPLLGWAMISAAGDPTNDATKTWPDDRRTIDAGTLVLERSAPQASGPCRDINYDPLVLPAGVEASDDPLLPARSAAYADSYLRRTSEEAHLPGTTAPKPETSR
jgi:hypothetical protein